MPSQGGTPVGEHVLDPIVLDPGFDPLGGTAEELTRYDSVQTAIRVYADALGSIVAHETGHALGLVQMGPPGGGLFGGSTGAEFSHAVEPDGTEPPENYLMKAGNTFSFQELAGLNGHELPTFRPLNYAWLRDRAVLEADLTMLLPPPVATTATPEVITGDTWLVIEGQNFADTPKIKLWSFGFEYNLILESWISETQIRGLVSYSQVLPGSYLVFVTNPDGQLALPPPAIVVQ
jgi:hypothetical protein